MAAMQGGDIESLSQPATQAISHPRETSAPEKDQSSGVDSGSSQI